MKGKPTEMSNTQRPKVKTPAPFDLDALEREDTPAPYRFTLGGREYVVATDPQEVEWQKLAAVGDDAIELMRLLLDEKDFEEFNKQKMPIWKLRRLVGRVMLHYGMGTVGEALASSTS